MHSSSVMFGLFPLMSCGLLDLSKFSLFSVKSQSSSSPKTPGNYLGASWEGVVWRKFPHLPKFALVLPGEDIDDVTVDDKDDDDDDDDDKIADRSPLGHGSPLSLTHSPTTTPSPTRFKALWK